MPGLIQKFFWGNVSKTVLLTMVLPLGCASFYGTVIPAAIYFPERYDWRMRVISNLTSPRDNPHYYWVPSLGIVVMALIFFPFAGYFERGLRAINSRAARSAGVAFACSFATLVVSFLAQLAQPVIGMGWVHEFLARVSATAFAVGMVCCCACAVKDRLQFCGGQRLLCNALILSWASLTLLPAIGLLILGSLVLLGHKADVVWAENLRQSFRDTMFWHLAFWEWVGAVSVTAFMIASAIWLPEPVKASS
jgi:hypothetical protein